MDSKTDAEYVNERAVTNSGGLTEGLTSPFIFKNNLKGWNKQKIDSVALKVFYEASCVAFSPHHHLLRLLTSCTALF